MTLVEAQLLAIRQSALATVASVDALLGALATPPPPPPPPREAEPVVESGTCRPACPPESRVPAPRMGALNAWVCSRCGKEGGMDGG